jgi:hypothetical protein
VGKRAKASRALLSSLSTGVISRIASFIATISPPNRLITLVISSAAELEQALNEVIAIREGKLLKFSLKEAMRG